MKFHFSNFKIILSPFWTAEIYGFGKQLSSYGFYPYCLPLCVYTDHGPGYYDEIPLHEIQSKAPVQLYHSPLSLDAWSRVSNKNAYCMYSPFVYFRKKNHITTSPESAGTLAFPAHSTPSIDDLRGYDSYIKSLKALPIEYQPVTVCLHMHDINKGHEKLFTSNGFKVVTAGDTLDQRFIARFYALLKDFKFTTSNIPGSYMYYSVEMGIPFFIHGEKPMWVNKSDPNINKGFYDPFERGYGKKAYDLFLFESYNDRYPAISKLQEKFVEQHLGLKDGIGRLQMSRILYVSLIKWSTSKIGILHILRCNILTRVVTRFLH
jgi:hypothetical protein